MFTQNLELTPGLNTLTYDLSFDERKASELKRLYNKDRKEGQRPVSVEAADNGAYYLRPGTYTLIVEVDGQTAETELEVK